MEWWRRLFFSSGGAAAVGARAHAATRVMRACAVHDFRYDRPNRAHTPACWSLATRCSGDDGDAAQRQRLLARGALRACGANARGHRASSGSGQQRKW